MQRLSIWENLVFSNRREKDGKHGVTNLARIVNLRKMLMIAAMAIATTMPYQNLVA